MVFRKIADKYTAAAGATSNTLSMSSSPVESSSKDSGKWGDSSQGRIDWEMGTENLFIQSDFDSLYKAMVSGEKVLVAFEIAQNANSDVGKPAEGWLIGPGGYEGLALITSLNANAPYEGDATYSATFKGCGPLNLREAPAIN